MHPNKYFCSDIKFAIPSSYITNDNTTDSAGRYILSTIKNTMNHTGQPKIADSFLQKQPEVNTNEFHLSGTIIGKFY